MLVLAALVAAACQAVPTRYVGPVAGCGAATRGLLDIEGSHVLFTPDEGILVLRGTIAADGTIRAEGKSPGPDAPLLRFAGHRGADRIDGTLSGDGCERTVALTPPKGGLQRALPDHSRLHDLF